VQLASRVHHLRSTGVGRYPRVAFA
jgi:hypothetical protein